MEQAPDLRGLFPNASKAFLVANGLEPPEPQPPRRAPAEPGITETEFQSQVIGLAEAHGWRVVHLNDSRGQKAVGWPDLVLIKDRLLFRELKRTGRRPTLVQQMMLDALTAAGADCAVWTPADWPEIHAAIQSGQKAAQ